MDQLKGWTLYLVVLLFAAFLAAALLLVYSLQPNSAGSWDFMQAMWPDDESQVPRSTSESAASNQQRVDWRTRQLQQMQARLDRQAAEYEALKKEYLRLTKSQTSRAGQGDSERDPDEWLRELESQMADSRSETQPVKNRPSDSNDMISQLQSKLDAAQSKLEATEYLYDMQLREANRLKDQIAAANEDQDESDAQTDAQLQRERELQAAASDALIRLGSASVPVLVQALQDNRPHVREWAAEMLGSMGQDAQAAVPTLVDALGDRDEFVRAAVQRALTAIERN